MERRSRGTPFIVAREGAMPERDFSSTEGAASLAVLPEFVTPQVT